jgi:hypothetical protein
MFSQIIERPKALRALLGTWVQDNAPGTVFFPSFAAGTSGSSFEMRQKVQEVMFMALRAYKWTSLTAKRAMTATVFRA